MESSIISLRKGQASLAIDTHGAFIRGWRVGRHVGLYSDPAKPNRATHPCGPNFSVLTLHPQTPKDGKYLVDGAQYQLPQHGFFRDRDWAVIQSTSHSAVLGIEADSESMKMYPFNFSATLSVRLTEQQLHYRLAFMGAGRAAPIDLASHTYHPWEQGMTIDGLSGLQYLDALDPRGILRVFKGNDFGGSMDREMHFRSKSHRSFTMRYPVSKTEISLRLGAAEDDIPTETTVVWSKPSEGGFICLEPVMIGVNSFNRAMSVPVSLGQTATLSFVLSMRGLR